MGVNKSDGASEGGYQYALLIDKRYQCRDTNLLG